MILKSKSDLQELAEIQASLDPASYELVEIPRWVVDLTDSLVQVAHDNISPNGFIETDKDWNVVEAIFKVWAARYPDDYRQFGESQKQVRANSFNDLGITKGKGGAEMQHQLNLPQKFDEMFRSLYPNQKFTKKFIQQLARKFPVFTVARSM